jgi:hypothetical protein
MKLSDWQNQKWQERAVVRKDRARDFQLANKQRREQERKSPPAPRISAVASLP